MKLQDVLLKAMAKKLTWWEAAEIIGAKGSRASGECHWRPWKRSCGFTRRRTSI